MIEITLISLMIIGVLMIPTPKKVKRDKYSDDVLEYVSGRLTVIDLRDKRC